MPRTPGRKGALPNDPGRPRINLGRVIRGTAPAQAHWGHIPSTGMLGNDQWGDCVFAGCGHIVEGGTFWGQGAEVTVTTDQVLAMDAAVTGFDPHAGPPGNNPTDQGSTLQAGLGYLVKTGLAGIKAAAFGELDAADTSSWQQALAEMGPLMAGVGVGDAEMQDFAAGLTWDVTPGQQANPEDHCVILCGFQPGAVFCWTWGGLQAMTPDWFSLNCAEVWGVALPSWVSKVRGTDPENVNLAEFGLQFSELTGQPDPFSV
jgi:hypothetical protein